MDHLNIMNRVIFCQKSFDAIDTFELFKYHFAWWARTTWGGSVPVVTEIYHVPSLMVTHLNTPTLRPNIVWRPLSQDTIKINVDNSFLVESMSSRIGGVFRDHFGCFLLYFGKCVTADSTIHTKILAIRKGILIAVASR